MRRRQDPLLVDEDAIANVAFVSLSSEAAKVRKPVLLCLIDSL